MKFAEEPDARKGAVIGRLQWSKSGVTIYDPNGGFIARLEHPGDIYLVNTLISDMLRLISEQQKKRYDGRHDAARKGEIQESIQPERTD